MSDDDPHVSRIIRTPQSVISIRGTLADTDRVYRLCSHALLDNGYGLKSPADNPWANYGAVPEENSDHLRRRLNELERQLSESQDHELIQSLRRKVLSLTLDCENYRLAFNDLDETIAAAVAMLDRDLTVRETILLDILTLG